MASVNDDSVASVLIYGLGAIGGAYAFFLSKNRRVSLHVIARSNYEVVKNHGMKIHSLHQGEKIFRADAVYRNATEAAEGPAYDYIICAQKASDQELSAEDIRSVVRPSTTIVIAQNGVGNEDPYRAKYPENSIIDCAVWIGAEQIKPGEFVTRQREATYIGLFPNAEINTGLEQQRLQTLASLFEGSGLTVSIDENIQTSKWEKLICNVLWNPLSTITQCDMGPTLLDQDKENDLFARALMLDVIKVGKAAGIPLNESLVDKYLQVTRDIGDFEPSMLHDHRRGRPLEIDVIVGGPMRKANALGLEVPTLRSVYCLIKAIDMRTRNEQKRL